MPFLQYKCEKCGKKFDELVKSYLDEDHPAAGKGTAL